MTRRRLPLLGLLAPCLLAPAAPACAAQGTGAPAPPRLALPLACTPGEDCWIPRHVDHDPGPGARDYACGPLTADGHGGTDFAVRDLLAVAEGVPVVAAAAGTVAAVRDGMPDAALDRLGGAAAVEGRECGNGVLIEHGAGFETQYCHLRRGSVLVERGDRVEAGQPLGAVGLSGLASFPHLEFTVRHRGDEVDPFVGIAAANGDGGGGRREVCGLGDAPLWSEDALAALPPYAPLVVAGAGFAPTAPEAEEARAGLYRGDGGALPRTSPALTLWVEAYGVRPGDAVSFRIEGPDGETLVDERREFDKGWARWFGYGGRRRPGAFWPPGRYRGEVAFERGAPEGGGGPPERFAKVQSVELR